MIFFSAQSSVRLKKIIPAILWLTLICLIYVIFTIILFIGLIFKKPFLLKIFLVFSIFSLFLPKLVFIRIIVSVFCGYEEVARDLEDGTLLFFIIVCHIFIMHQVNLYRKKIEKNKSD